MMPGLCLVSRLSAPFSFLGTLISESLSVEESRDARLSSSMVKLRSFDCEVEPNNHFYVNGLKRFLYL